MQLNKEHNATAFTAATLNVGVRYLKTLQPRIIVYVAIRAPFVDGKLRDKREWNKIHTFIFYLLIPRLSRIHRSLFHGIRQTQTKYRNLWHMRAEG